MASIPILVVIFMGILNAPMKDRIVFWRWNNPLPGCRAFSKPAGKDHRVKLAILSKYPPAKPFQLPISCSPMATPS